MRSVAAQQRGLVPMFAVVLALGAECPSGGRAEASLPSYRALADQAHGEQVSMPALRFDYPPVLDGRLDEWQGFPYAPLVTRAQSNFDADWNGASDCCGRFRVGWDADYLYVGAEMLDDRMEADSDPLTDDALEVVIEADTDHPVIADGRLAASLGMETSDAERRTLVLREGKPGRLVFGAEGIATGDGSVYTVEVRVAWSLVRRQVPVEGQRLGFDLAFHDADGSDRPETTMRWSGAQQGDGVRLGTLQLTGAGHPSARNAQPGLVAFGSDRSYFLPGETGTVTLCSGYAALPQEQWDCHLLTPEGDFRPLRNVGAWRNSLLSGWEWECTVPGGIREGVLVAEPRLGGGPHVVTPLSLADDRARHIEAQARGLRDRLLSLARSDLHGTKGAAVATWWWHHREIDDLFADAVEPERRPNIAWLAHELPQLQRTLDEVVASGDQRPTEPGVSIRAHLSPLDDSLQPYSVYVPEGYPAPDAVEGEDYSAGYPLVVKLHGLGGTYSTSPPDPEFAHCLVLCPYGRGNTDYKAWGEVDVMQVLDEVQRDYFVDPNRVYATGFSMGGTGSWQVGVHYPDRFAGIAPFCGNADHHAWRVRFGWVDQNPSAMSPLKDYLENLESNTYFAESLYTLPAYCVHGSADEYVPVEHSRLIVGRLRELKYDVTYDEQAGVGHSFFGSGTTERVYDWLLQQRRDPNPKRVVYKTAWLRHGGAYWVHVDRFVEPVRFALIEAEVDADNQVWVKTDNIGQFTLDLTDELVDLNADVTLIIDGRKQNVQHLPADGRVTLARREAGTDGRVRWAPPRPRDGLIKRAGLEGPIEDALLSRFLVVYGTTGDDAEDKANRDEALRLDDFWQRWANARVRLKADHEVTEQDLRDSNLILFGNCRSNSLVRQVNDDLPIRFDDTAVVMGDQRFEGEDVGLKVIYPNPLNPERYVVVMGGTTWQGTQDANERFGNWFDWGLFDNRGWFDYGVFDRRTRNPESFLAVGFFDQDWKLNERYLWAGIPEEREEHHDRIVPAAEPDELDGSVVYLSDLKPTRVSLEKGALAVDCSFEGRTLQLGDTFYKKGLGVHPDTEVVYDLDGRFHTFSAWVGPDYEGAEVSQARKDVEKVSFEVHGDGKLLAETDRKRWDAEPEYVYLDVTGVKEFKLVCKRHATKRWLFGDWDWADAKLTRVPEALAVAFADGSEDLAATLSLDGEWSLRSFDPGEGIQASAHREIPKEKAPSNSSSGYGSSSYGGSTGGTYDDGSYEDDGSYDDQYDDGAPGGAYDTGGYGAGDYDRRGDSGSSTYGPGPSSYGSSSGGYGSSSYGSSSYDSSSKHKVKLTVRVPGTVQQALQAAGKLDHPYRAKDAEDATWIHDKEWWYHREFDVPEEWRGRAVALELEGVNYVADVWLNGEAVSTVEGMWNRERLPVGSFLKFGETNLLAIRVCAGKTSWTHAPAGVELPDVSTALACKLNYGLNGMPPLTPLGLWRPIRLRTTGPVALVDPVVETVSASPESATLRVKATLVGKSGTPLSVTVAGSIRDEEGETPAIEICSAASVAASSSTEFVAEVVVHGPRLWWPHRLGESPLYTLDLEVRLETGQVSDRAATSFGVRQLASADEGLQVNGRPLSRLHGAVWLPLDLLLNLPAARYRHFVELAKSAGVDAFRVWAGGLLETDEFYTVCDRAGMLVVQDFPLLGCERDLPREGLLHLAADNVRRLQNHPSLIAWSGGADPDLDDPPTAELIEALGALCASVDPGRPFLRHLPERGRASSPWLQTSADSVGAWSFLALPVAAPPKEAVSHWLKSSGYGSSAETWEYHGATESLLASSPFADEDDAESTSDSSSSSSSYGSSSYSGSSSYGDSYGSSSTSSSSKSADTIGQLLICQSFLSQERLSVPWRDDEAGRFWWQFADPWPQFSSSLVDWTGLPKPAYYELKASQRPLSLVPELSGRVVPVGQALRVGATVTSTDSVHGTVRQEILAPDMDVLAESHELVTLGAGETGRLKPFSWTVPLHHADRALFVRTRFLDDRGEARADNLQPFATRGGTTEPTAVTGLWITDDVGDARAATEPLGAYGIEVAVTRPDELAQGVAAEVIIADLTSLDDDDVAALKALCGRSAGQCGLLLYGVPAGGSAAAAFVQETVPFTVSVREADADPVAVEIADTDHPLFEGLSAYALPKARSVALAVPSPNAHALLTTAEDQALLLEASRNGTRCLFLVSDLQDDWGRALRDEWRGFRPFLVNTFAYLARLSHPEQKRLRRVVAASQPWRPLESMPKTELEAVASADALTLKPGESASFTVKVTNKGDAIAFFVAIGFETLPADVLPWVADNYFSLQPGESRTVPVRLTVTDPVVDPGEATLVVSAWNVEGPAQLTTIEVGEKKPTSTSTSTYDSGAKYGQDNQYDQGDQDDSWRTPDYGNEYGPGDGTDHDLWRSPGGGAFDGP